MRSVLALSPDLQRVRPKLLWLVLGLVAQVGLARADEPAVRADGPPVRADGPPVRADGSADRVDGPAVRLVAVGDLLFGRYLQVHGRTVYAPVTTTADPFAEVRRALLRADIAFGNLETPILPDPGRVTQYGITFRADPERADTLAAAGFHVLSLANNHATNLGPDGAVRTRRALLRSGVLPVGAGEEDPDAEPHGPVVLNRNGLRVCVLAYTLWKSDHPRGQQGLAYVRPSAFLDTVPAAVRKARADTAADFTIVSLHWGAENVAHPSAEQRAQARALIDAGADVVLGHHPHVLQDFERYRGGVIAYSLGNFLFDNPSLEQRQTAILSLVLTRRGAARQVAEPALLPVLIGKRDCLPRPARGADRQALVQRLGELAPGLDLLPADEPAGPSQGLVLGARR